MPHLVLSVITLVQSRVGPPGAGCPWRPAHSERGASLVEYALLVALIAVACIAAVTFFGGATGSSLSRSDHSMFGS